MGSIDPRVTISQQSAGVRSGAADRSARIPRSSSGMVAVYRGRCAGIDEMKRAIGGADIPDAYEVIKVRHIPDEKAGNPTPA